MTSLAVTSWPSRLRTARIGADDRNTWKPHVKRASASTARRRTMIGLRLIMIRLDLGRRSHWLDDALVDVDGIQAYCSVMTADAAATRRTEPQQLCLVWNITREKKAD